MLIDTLDRFDALNSAMFSALADAAQPAIAPMDVTRDGERYILETDLPGMDPDSIDVSLEGRWLTISAERTSDQERQDAQWLVRERSTQSIVRRVPVGEDVDLDHIAAEYHDGVLRVVLPVRADARGRKVPVAGVTGRDAITANAQSPEHAEGKAPAALSHAS